MSPHNAAQIPVGIQRQEAALTLDRQQSKPLRSTKLIKKMLRKKLFLASCSYLGLLNANASVLCGIDSKGIWSAKISAGGQIFTSNPSGSSTSENSGSSTGTNGLNSNVGTFTGSSSSSYSNIFNDGFIGLGEIIYKPAKSRLSYGAGYSYSRYTTSSTSSGSSIGSSSTVNSFPGQPDNAYSATDQSTSFTSTPKTTQTEQTIRLSGYWDISDPKWKAKPYLLAAIAAVNTKTQGASTAITSSQTGTFTSGGTTDPTTSQSTSSSSQGSTNGWSFNPEIGLGIDVPLNKSISLGSEFRYVLTGTNTNRPIIALGYVKYNFGTGNEKGQSSTDSCEAISVKSTSAPALQKLLSEATPSEITELTDYLKQKRKLSAEGLQK